MRLDGETHFAFLGYAKNFRQTPAKRQMDYLRQAAGSREGAKELKLYNLSDYFTSLNGHRPAHLYDLVLREVEEPLFRVVLDYAEGNQSRAAGILGINRGTLRKKLKELGLSGGA